MGHSIHTYAGIVLAAGRGRRMGTAKQLLPIRTSAGAETTMITAAFDVLAPCCGERMVVVMGHEAPKVAAALAPRRFITATSDPDADMMHSVRIGLKRSRLEFPDVSGHWLHLADHPMVRAGTVDAVRRAFEVSRGERAVMPEHAGHGGHPALIPARVVDEILSWKGDGGLRAFWIEHPERCIRLGVNDPGTTRDIDTPEDYRATQDKS